MASRVASARLLTLEALSAQNRGEEAMTHLEWF